MGDILNYRDQIEAEHAQARNQEAAPVHSSRWLPRWFRSSAKKSDEDTTNTYGLSPDEMKAINEAIGYTAQPAAAGHQESAAYISATAAFHLGYFSLALVEGRRTQHLMPDQAQVEVILLKSYEFAAMVTQRAAVQALAVKLSLQEMLVADTTLPDGQQSILVQRCKHNDHAVAAATATFTAAAASKPVLDIHFEINPLDSVADSLLRLKSEPLEIEYRPALVARLAAFFTKPDNVVLDDISNAASSGIESLRQSSRAGMQYALETHKTLLLDVSIGAPTILMPAPQAGLLLVLDLGKLALTSTVEPRDHLHSKGDMESAMYDLYTVSLTDMQVLLLDSRHILSSSAWAAAVEQASTDQQQQIYHLLDKSSVSIHVFNCVQQDNPEYAKLKVSGALPSLHLRVSDLKVKQLMAMVAELAPSPSPASTPPTPPATAALVHPQACSAKDNPLAVEARTGNVPAAAQPIAALDMQSRDRAFHSFVEEPDADHDTRSVRTESFASASSVLVSSLSTGSRSRRGRRRRRRQPGNDLDCASEDDFFSASSGSENEVEKSENGLNYFHSKQEEALPLEVRIRRVLMMATCVIDQVAVTLSEWDIQTGKERDLVELRILQLGVTKFCKRSFDMQAELSLMGLDVLDLWDTSSVQSFVLQSNPVDTLAGLPRTSVSSSLMSISVAMADPTSPVFTTQHQSVKQRVKCHLGDLRWVANEATLVKLKRFVANTCSTEAQPASKTTKVHRVAGVGEDGGADNPNEAARFIATRNGVVDLALSVHFASLELLVRSRGRRVAGMALSGITAAITQTPLTSQVTAKLDCLRVENLLPGALHRDIVSTVGSDVFDLALLTDITPTAWRSRTHLDLDLTLATNALRVVFLNQFMDELVVFATVVMAQVDHASSQPTPVPSPLDHSRSMGTSVQKDSRQKVRYRVILKAPDIIVPLSASSPRQFVLELGKIFVSNEEVLEETHLRLTDLQMYFHHEQSTGRLDERSMVMQPASIEVTARILQEQTSVICTIPAVRCNFSDHDYADVMVLLAGNLSEKSDRERPLADPVPAKPAIGHTPAENTQPAGAAADGERVTTSLDFCLGLLDLQLSTGSLCDPLALLTFDSIAVQLSKTKDAVLEGLLSIRSLDLVDSRVTSLKVFPPMVGRCPCCVPEAIESTHAPVDRPAGPLQPCARRIVRTYSSRKHHARQALLSINCTKRANDMVVRIGVNRLRLYITADLTNALLNFLPQKSATPKEGGLGVMSASAVRRDAKDQSLVPASLPAELPAGVFHVTVHLALNDMQINAIADCSTLESLALRLVLHGDLAYTTSDLQKHLHVDLMGVQVCRCPGQ